MRIAGPNATARFANASATAPGRRPAASRSPKSEAPKSPRRSRRCAPSAASTPARAAGPGRSGRAASAARSSAGGIALDALDELKVEVLAGTLGPVDLDAVEGGHRRPARRLGRRRTGRGAGRDRAAAGGRNRQDEPPPLAPFSGRGAILRCQKRHRNSASWPEMRVSAGRRPCPHSVLVGAPADHYKLAREQGRLDRVGWGYMPTKKGTKGDRRS